MALKNYHIDYLRRAVDCIVNQQCQLWRMLIIVEENDFAGFSDILEDDLCDSRIEMIKNEGRKLAGAMNTGMGHARTDFVAILLADDMWSNDAVALLTQYIDRFSDVDFFHSSRVIIDENDKPISSIHYSKETFSLEDFLRSSPVKHLLCWRKDLALSFGGMDESLNSVGPDDYDFPWCMAEQGARFKAVKECLYLYRDHREAYRLTTHLPLSVHKREIKRIMRKHGASSSVVNAKIAAATESYLRQCLFRSRFDRFVKEQFGYDARYGWRERYR